MEDVNSDGNRTMDLEEAMNYSEAVVIHGDWLAKMIVKD